MTESQPLAAAFLALSDEPPAAPPPRWSAARAACALAAAIVLSCAGPLAWSAAAEGRPADHPVAVPAGGKATPSEADDEADE